MQYPGNEVGIECLCMARSGWIAWVGEMGICLMLDMHVRSRRGQGVHSTDGGLMSWLFGRRMGAEWRVSAIENSS
jgi:hypothetical protein